MYTYIMVRTQIYLSEEIHHALGTEARRSGRTRSDLIREAVGARYLHGDDKAALRAALDTSFGAWGAGEDGAAFVDRVRPGRLQALRKESET